MSDAPAPKPFVPVRFAVLAVSDSRTLADDRSGATLAERITGAGHILADRALVTDDAAKIPQAGEEMAEGQGRRCRPQPRAGPASPP